MIENKTGRESIKTGLIQMTCCQDKYANINKAVYLIREAARKGAQIVCMPELFSSEYFCWEENYDYFSLAEPIPGPTTNQIRDLARELNIVILASIFEKRAGGVYHNTLAVFNADGTLLGKYRKNHIPDDPGYFEKFYFTPGDLAYPIFMTKYARIGGLICWDQWYPEAARIISLMGAEMIFYPTAIGWADSQTEAINRQQYSAWQTIQRAHAIANGVYVIAVNRTGREHEMNFWGGSFIANPFGEILFQASHDKEEVHVENIDLLRIDEARIHWPFLRDRRIDSYGPILNRYIDEE